MDLLDIAGLSTQFATRSGLVRAVDDLAQDLIGAAASALAGYIGMMVTVRANVRTTQAASKGLQNALTLSFKGGSVTGIMVVGLGIIGLAGSGKTTLFNCISSAQADCHYGCHSKHNVDLE